MQVKLRRFSNSLWQLAVFASLILSTAATVGDETGNAGPAGGNQDLLRDRLTTQEWQELDRAVDHGLEFLAKQQQEDGSFQTLEIGQPGVTSLCILAFVSRGHLPYQGPYGERIERAIEYVLSTQQADGLLCAPNVDPAWQKNMPSHTAVYNHAISALMLSEVYGMTANQNERIRRTIRRAISYSLQYEKGFGKRPGDHGGFRYVRRHPRTSHSDVSVTAWQLMFFRSARNGEFDVPADRVQDAMNYIKRCFNQKSQLFVYGLYGSNPHRVPTRGVQGAAIVSLCMAGEHESEMARAAADWIRSQSFKRYNRITARKDRYHYSAFYCSQAMFQLGGEYWAEFYPELMRTLVRNQAADGSWERERQAAGDARFGETYTSSLAVLALTPVYQLLPIYQR